MTVQLECLDHEPVQHLDGKQPWCRVCGLDASGNEPVAALAVIERVVVEIEAVAGGISSSSEAAGYRNGLLRAAQIVRAALDDPTNRLTPQEMEKFGRAVYEIMDGEEWTSDTLQAIGDYAAMELGLPFSEPDNGLEEW